jgi:hypothetical protein
VFGKDIIGEKENVVRWCTGKTDFERIIYIFSDSESSIRRQWVKFPYIIM